MREWLLAAIQDLRVPHADIYLVGWGMRTPSDLTLEGVAVLDRVERVFCLPAPPDLPVRGGIVDLSPHYGVGLPRHEVYNRIADDVLEAAEHGPVALATFGSATVGTAAAHLVLRQAPARGLVAHAVPSVSCLEAFWADVGIEPFNGVLVWDATAFVVNQAVAPPNVDLVLAGVTVLHVHVTQDQYRPVRPADLAPLREHLLRSYAPRHPAAFVCVARDEAPARLTTTTVGDLASSPTDVSTLFVPADPAWRRPEYRARRRATVGVTRLRLRELLDTARSGS